MMLKVLINYSPLLKWYFPTFFYFKAYIDYNLGLTVCSKRMKQTTLGFADPNTTKLLKG